MRAFSAVTSRKFLPLLLGVVYLILLLGGWQIYMHLRNHIQQRAEEDLAAIAELKKSQIEAWLDERFGDAEVYGDNSALAHDLGMLIQSGTRQTPAWERALHRLRQIQRVYHYAAISVYDRQGRPVLATDGAGEQQELMPQILATITQNLPRLVDFHLQRSAAKPKAELGVLWPMVVDGETTGALYFAIDPDYYLNPLIQRWPGQSASAETLLVRRQGNAVEFLNPLRHRADPPLTLKVSLDRRRMPVVEAARGARGIYQHGVDYRGEPVLAYITAISRTPWLMIGKLDETEAFGEVRTLTITVSAVTLLVLLTSTALMLAWMRETRSRLMIQELKLALESNQLEATIEAIPDLLFEMDISGRFFEVRDSSDKLLAAPAERLVGRTVWQVMPVEPARAVMRALREAAKHGISRGTQVRLKVPDDGDLWIELSVSRKAKVPGQAIRLVVLSRNITERKQIEIELEKHRSQLQELVDERTVELVGARVDAERANQAKSLFLANMSHELRTPMHAILSFARLGVEKTAGREEPQMVKLHQFFDRIAQSGERLLRLLNDLLDLSKLESGKMSLHLQRHSLRTLVEAACHEMSILAEQKAINFDIAAIGPDLMLECDAQRIDQVLNNLIANAIKYSPACGTIRISASPAVLPGRRADDSGRPSVMVRVEDEGVGIPHDEFEFIFDKFVQSSKTDTKAGGTGLGLSICREIIEMHGGTIHAENNPERGALLVFTLPLEHAETGHGNFGG